LRGEEKGGGGNATFPPPRKSKNRKIEKQQKWKKKTRTSTPRLSRGSPSLSPDLGSISVSLISKNNSDCGWIYVPSVEGADFTTLDRFKCPVCSAPKRRFSPYGGAAGKGVNDLKTRKERKAKLQGGGGGGGKEAGNRRASGEGVDSGDAGKLAAAVVGAIAIAGALYAVLNASL